MFTLALAAVAMTAAVVAMVVVVVVMMIMMVMMMIVMMVMMMIVIMVVEMMLVHIGILLVWTFLYYTDTAALCQNISFSGNNPREGLRNRAKAGIIKVSKKGGAAMSHTHDQDHPHSHTYFHAHGMAHSHGHVHENQKAVVNRLSRAIGHLDKVKRMVEEGYDCSEVLIQLAAVRSALDNTGKVILKDHMRHCMVDAVAAGDSDAIDDLCSAIDKFMK